MDKQKLERYLNSFSRMSGLKVALMDRRFHGIMVCGYDAGAYCSILHTSQACLETCIDSNAIACQTVKERGEAFFYRCPFGFGEITAPIKEGNAVLGYLMAGPILECDGQDEAFLRQQLSENGLDGEDEKTAEAIAGIRRCSAETVRSLCDMLSMIAEYIGAEGFMRDCEKTVGQMVKDHVKRNLSGRITLAELSAQAHCSTVTLTEHFRREFGMSVMEYVTQKRLQLAQKLLLDSKLSVTDIAGRCGFCSAEYFSRCFKRAYGVSPSRFRGPKTVSCLNFDGRKNKKE